MNQDTTSADALHRVILAAMRLMYDPKTFPLFKAGITKNAPLPQILATETGGLIQMMDKQSKGTIPRDILPQAAVAILAEIAKFMKEAKIANPSEADVRAGIQQLMGILVKFYGQQPATQQVAQPQQPQAPAGLISQGA